jgi:ABC-2 type transport system permease protein
LVVGGALAPSLLAVGQVGLHAAVGAALFDLALGGVRLAPMVAALVATVIACAPIGLVGAAAWMVLRRPGLVTTAALFSFGVLGGVYFPVQLIPAPIAELAQWVPLTAGLDAVRAALLEGAGWSATAPSLRRLALIAALTLPPSILLLRATIARACRRGSLALV